MKDQVFTGWSHETHSELRDLFYNIVLDTKRTRLSPSNDLARGRGLKLWGVAQQSKASATGKSPKLHQALGLSSLRSSSDKDTGREALQQTLRETTPITNHKGIPPLQKKITK
jgi:hypothetical protein